jgi:putative methionine-R-sulfoxide reductase with GAF domain
VSAYDGVPEAVDRILERGGDADDVLRQVVAILHGMDDFSWVGISFVEEGELVLGPAQGEPTAEPMVIPISYDNNVVAEIGVVTHDFSAEDRIFLERVALLISPYCLVGWDTGGESWSP